MKKKNQAFLQKRRFKKETVLAFNGLSIIDGNKKHKKKKRENEMQNRNKKKTEQLQINYKTVQFFFFPAV